ncbi:Na+/H+ antiporter NhaC family protein [Paenibacillus sp. 481]|uniref:Na+/H+ antiporter NhaC family protein n=1 Tax=Paenibacillus sp. 481 TaxID=2835869 RepID=UPI001E364754|nr:Na+/H+ antiporter NhaC family protein [Paenibacillus sp. 481]UHA74923.1 sodium:proton antiporter [Paenibacillus sp. 481]
MLSKNQLITVVVTTIGGLTAAYLLGIPLILGFALGFATLTLYSRKQGVAWSTLTHAMRDGATHTLEVVWILVMVGLVIPTWTLSGTIPYLIEQGLQWIHPAYMVTLTFWFAALFSMLLGTSTGTLSAVGIPMMGAAAIAGVPLPLMAGALVSGAFVGDRTSPFSSAHRLVADSTGTTVSRQYPAMAPTTLLGLGAATAFFLFMDLNGSWATGSSVVHLDAFRQQFTFSPWLVLPAVVLIGAILFRLKTRYAFMLSIATAIVLGVWLQDVAPMDWVRSMLFGYENTALPSLHTKGLLSMLDLVLLIALAGSYNGILEATRTLEPYMVALMGQQPSLPSATVKVGLFGLALGLVSCTQTLPIMMAGRNVLPLWSSRFPKEQLSRVIADTALVFAAMVPWNMLAVLCGTILGVPVHEYVPYAVFLWSLPLFTLIVSTLMRRRYITYVENKKAG